MKIIAPDLGYSFIPSVKKLNKLARGKAIIICNWLDDNSYLLIEPDKTALIAYLKKRMREQGRFAGLKVSKRTNVYFLKFPLGGKSAGAMATREATVYHYINTMRHDLPITKTAEVVETPLGKGLLIDYFEDKRLENVKKSDKLNLVADLLYKMQALPVRTVKTTPGVSKYLYGNGTDPIHIYKDYFTSVDDRIKQCLNGKTPRFSPSMAKKIYKKIGMLRPSILKYENRPIFAHRDFFDRNIIVPSSTLEVEKRSGKTSGVYLVDFEHAAIVKNYLLGLNFDLANIVVQWYRYPRLNKKLISLVREKYLDKNRFDISLQACLIIQILAKIDYTAQEMIPGGVEENVALLEEIVKE